MDHRSLVGDLLLVEKDGALVGLYLEGDRYPFESAGEEMQAGAGTPLLEQTREWLDRYFAGEKPHIDELPLAPAGSGFRQKVWEILCGIPYGETTTYKEIAQEIAAAQGIDKMSAQAVGGAVGHNPISIIIPCHRVVGTNGSLTGYGGGLEKKIKLLEFEGVDMDRFFIPKKGTAL